MGGGGPEQEGGSNFRSGQFFFFWGGGQKSLGHIEKPLEIAYYLFCPHRNNLPLCPARLELVVH
jgi:hypothetical protein